MLILLLEQICLEEFWKQNFCRIIETHSPISALIAENVNLKNGELSQFDGFWSSSLTDSTLKGKPDIEVLEINQRINSISEILDVTTKPYGC